jgi:N-alpha-acetyl-L-2,4-diaminobutyrate deacetylase
MSASPIFATVDFDRPGNQLGQLRVPYSHNLGGWANLMMPLAIVANGPGRTALVLGGNHGDEYPGPIAILKLMRALRPEQVRGRLILIPALNVPAVRAATRLSPLDGKNLNRCFPGRPDGTLTEQVAHYLSTVLFPMADVVIDVHTGGRSTDFVPCAHMHLVPDRAQRRQMMEGTLAWGTDLAFLYTDVAGTGLLPVEAERQGKVVITTEMGGSENVTAQVHRLTQEGLANVLRHLGILEGEVQTRAQRGLPPTRWVQALDREDYRLAPESGLYENLVPLGESVRKGQALGQIHFLERPDREAVPVEANADGVLVACRAPTLVGQGDCVACVAHEVDAAVLAG